MNFPSEIWSLPTWVEGTVPGYSAPTLLHQSSSVAVAAPRQVVKFFPPAPSLGSAPWLRPSSVVAFKRQWRS